MGDIDVSTLMPAAIVAAIFGIVEVLKAAYFGKYPKAPVLPWWFILAPLFLGLTIGFGYWFVITTTETIKAMTVARRVLTAFFQGLGYGGASVILYEVKKAFQARNVDINPLPTPPPPTVLPPTP